MRYIAFLRGIGPGDPRMRNDRLRNVFENLGFKNVQSVISSGNIIFQTDELDQDKLERDIQAALSLELEINGETFIRAITDLENLIALQPFGNMTHSSRTYLMVTFLKQEPDKMPALPYASDDGTFRLLGYDAKSRALFSVTDASVPNVSNVMPWIDKQFSKHNTSRTWNTILRVHKKL